MNLVSLGLENFFSLFIIVFLKKTIWGILENMLILDVDKITCQS